jgi:hypothetical protein
MDVNGDRYIYDPEGTLQGGERHPVDGKWVKLGTIPESAMDEFMRLWLNQNAGGDPNPGGLIKDGETVDPFGDIPVKP